MITTVKTPILFLVMEFAPINTTGNFRSSKFVKYLDDFGIQPIVLTFEVKSGCQAFNTIADEELLNEFSDDILIYRSPVRPISAFLKKGIGNTFRIYSSIEEGLAQRWVDSSFWEQLDEIIREYQPKIIFTSLPPFSSGRLGVKVSKRYDLPLIVDMRDAWSLWSSSPFPTRIHYYLTHRKENYIFQHASAIIGVTPQLVEDFKVTHPTISKEKFYVITNGYDDVQHMENNRVIKLPPLAEKDKFVIGYVGSFYYSPEGHKEMHTEWWKRKGHKKFYYTPRKENWLYRSPYFFFKALHRLLKESPELRDKIRFDFVGRIPTWFERMIKEFDLTDILHTYGFVSHKKALEIQSTFDAFLTTSEKIEDGEHYCLPSKIFDYIRKEKPILGFVTSGIQRDFLDNIGIGFICDPDDQQQAVSQLRKVIQGGRDLEVNESYLEKFHRKNLTYQLVQIIQSVLN